MLVSRLLPGIVVALACMLPGLPGEEKKTAWWPAAVEEALSRAGKNRPELEKALHATPAEQRKGMAFLMAHMPKRDLRALGADFLRENVELAYQARKERPWGSKVPEEVFFNDVLPYANLDEERHPWRKKLGEICRPLVKDCKTPAEAAGRLNATLFGKLKVRFSTGRKKANQSPQETIEQGLASCTGLSILLVDACRSVCVPARVVGTPLWANKRGNHTWLEVWDGRWHFTGAAEPDPRGLDRAWFVHDAAQAQKDSPVHAIYAASYRRTLVPFPLVWDPECEEFCAENVTDRYTAGRAAPASKVRVQVRVVEEGTRKRLVLPVRISDRKDAAQVWYGQSHGERADPNDFLTFELSPRREYLLRVGERVVVTKAFLTPAGKEQLVDVTVPAVKEKKPALAAEQLARIEKEARAFFDAGARQKDWRFEAQLDRWLAQDDEAVRAAVWKAYRAAGLHADLKADFARHQVRAGKYLSPYVVKEVGKRPLKGWPLFIAMHGGGNAPKKLNDSQWKVMQRYYRDQPSVTGYQYLALRAPDDSWNGFYRDDVLPLFVNLVRQFLLFGDVDPDKVFLMGYSHGGYGAFFVGPKMPDRFAAVHVSAAAPTDGTISARNLRHTFFSFMIGEDDDAYGRRQRCEAFGKVVQKLKDANPDDYPVKMELMKGFGHGGLPDRDKIKEMYPHVRHAVPGRLSWELTDRVVRHFFWLGVERPQRGGSVEARLEDNAVEITARTVEQVEVHLDARLVRFDRPLKVLVEGKKKSVAIAPSLLTLCRSMQERGDPELAWTCTVRVAEK
jgi:hypothetical protein